MKHEELQELVREQVRLSIKSNVNSSSDVLSEGVIDWFKRKFGIKGKQKVIPNEFFPQAHYNDYTYSAKAEIGRKTLANKKVGPYKLIDIDKTIIKMNDRYDDVLSGRSSMSMSELDKDSTYLSRTGNIMMDNLSPSGMTDEEIRYIDELISNFEDANDKNLYLLMSGQETLKQNAKDKLNSAKSRRTQ